MKNLVKSSIGKLLKMKRYSSDNNSSSIKIVFRGTKKELDEGMVNDHLMVKDLYPAGTHILGEFGEGKRLRRFFRRKK